MQNTRLEDCLYVHWEYEECALTENNFIGAIGTKTEIGCFLECSLHYDCKYYTYYSTENANFQEECLLYSSLDVLTECTGCYSGQLIFPPPTTNRVQF